MRIYPVKIKSEETKEMSDRVSIDAEDLLDLMIQQELINYNLLENWFIVKNRIIDALNQPIAATTEGEKIVKE